jgi:NAD(P)-dependent dehydrogenase (short-subunit alcohol dehydrogenase family)
MRGLNRKVALVTGGGRGIGRGVSLRLAEEGCAVAVVDLDASLAASTAREIGARGGVACSLEADISDETIVAGLMARAERELGSVPDIAICNAGIQQRKNLFDVSGSEFDRLLAVNARGCFLTMKAAGAAMAELSRGAIVATASISGRMPDPYGAHYAASKAAVISLVKSFALALAPRGVRVNAVAPGIVDTDLLAASNDAIARMRGQSADQVRRSREAAVPLRRAATPEDIAAAVAFLASEDAAYITGECLHVAGGQLMV